MEETPAGGIYIHIPFCRRKCIYCDFYSVGERCLDARAYVCALEKEYAARVQELGKPANVSLYIGGGTPSLLPPEAIGELREKVEFPVGEFTLEMNPDDVTAEKARGWRQAGVNRISMGVQSLRDDELRAIGRRHDAADARRAYEILRGEFDNVSLDLMFGLPGQTLESLGGTLDEFIEMRPEHISAYSLMYEERAAITRMRDKGMLAETPEDISVAMFRMINQRLAEAGYERYEISNYALSGRRSQHNSGYWVGMPYLGLGPSAHSYDGKRTRRRNPADLNLYMKASENFGEPFYETETLTDEELLDEMIMTRLRRAEGLSMQEVETRFGAEDARRILRQAEPYIKSGELLQKDMSIIFSESGVMISDEIIVDLM